MKASERAAGLGWGGLVVDNAITVNEVPFTLNPEELIPTDGEMDELRDGFDDWMETQS